MKYLYTILIASFVLTGCVSQKKYAELQAENERLKAVGPASEARQEASQQEMKAKLEEIEMLKLELKEREKAETQMKMMIEAGEIEQPTAEQMRVYEMQHMDELQKAMAPGENPEDMQQSQMAKEFEATAFENRLVVRAMESTLKNYNKEQIDFDKVGGRTVVCVDSKELFSAGSTDLSDQGKSLMAKIAVTLEGGAPLYYRISGVTKGDDPESIKKATERALAVYTNLNKSEGSPRLPIAVGASSCEDAAGTTKNIGCDRIEIILEQDYERIMGLVEENSRQR